MTLLLLLSGNSALIYERIGLSAENVDEVKIGEKMLASPRRILALMRQKPYDKVVWGCKALPFQRFRPFMHLYTFFSSCRNGVIVDEFGEVEPYRTFTVIIRDIPLIVLQFGIAALVAVFSYIRLPSLKRRFTLHRSQHR